MFSFMRQSVIKTSTKSWYLLLKNNNSNRVRNFSLLNVSKSVCFSRLNFSHFLNDFYGINSLQKFSTSLKMFSDKFSNSYNERDDYNEDYDEDIKYEELVKQTLRLPDMGHQVFVIQPYIKWGRLKRKNTKPALQLAESEALIKTLHNWNVVCSKIVPLMSFRSPMIFGKGNLKSLKEEVDSNKTISAIFISINMLSPKQQEAMEKAFGVPIFDRYTIVVQIFKMHAVSKEAKLQVALGELPYLWSRLKHDKSDMSDKMGGGATVGGPGESYLEIKRRLLQDKERKLKIQIKKLKTQRELLRNKRQKLEIPVVAVVGYTNAGKTSLIKALTKEEKMQPKNVLFATLDVTVHAGVMPCGLKVLFVDTVGFLSDIPTNLIQSFVATLEDAMQADLIIHVQDISHPDLTAQNEHVLDTLKSIDMPETLLETMITVGNKVDLVEGSRDANYSTSTIPVSSTHGYGLDVLRRKVEHSIIAATGQLLMKIRIPNGGEELVWLHKEATVTQVAADDLDNQFVFVDTIITKTNLKKFKHLFITSKVNR